MKNRLVTVEMREDRKCERAFGKLKYKKKWMEGKIPNLSKQVITLKLPSGGKAGTITLAPEVYACSWWIKPQKRKSGGKYAGLDSISAKVGGHISGRKSVDKYNNMAHPYQGGAVNKR